MLVGIFGGVGLGCTVMWLVCLFTVSVLVCPLFVLFFGLSSDYIGWCGLLFKFLIYPGDDDDDGVTLILN